MSLTMIVIAAVVEFTENSRFREAQRAKVLEKIGTLRAKLEGALNGELLLSRSLTTLIFINGGIDRETFMQAAGHFFVESKYIRNIALAKGTVIEYVFPLEGNEKAVGRNYSQIPAQWPSVKRALETRKTVVAGPVNLVQGGKGIIGRIPIFIPEKSGNQETSRYFGLLSVVIDIPKLFTHAGISGEGSGLALALRGLDGLGAGGEVFYGDPSLFSGDSVKADVAFSDNSWVIAATPVEGWVEVSPRIFYYRLSFAFIICTLILLIALRAREALLRLDSERRLAESELRFRSLFDSSADGIVVIDPETAGFLEFNEQVCNQLGYSKEEFASLKIFDLDLLESRDETASHIRKVMEEGYGEFETLQRSKLGEPRNVHVKARYTSFGGNFVYHCIWRDITKEKKEELILQARLHLIEFSLSHTLDELLTETLNKLESLTGSQMGFFHFYNEDKRLITLHIWSTRTAAEFCAVQGAGTHHGLENAGVWVDCVQPRKPVIHNDYATLPHKKGLPPGHAPVIRELVVPIIRSDKVVAFFGIGNKASIYTDEDVAVVTRLADLAWDVAERKLVQDSLRESEERFSLAFNNAPIIISITDLKDAVFLDVNQRFVDVLGFSREEVIGESSINSQWLSESERLRLMERLNSTGRVQDFEITLRAKTGNDVLCKYWGEIIKISGKKALLSIAMDITAHRKVEQQLVQSQKMESVGRLAGGVAHDFNNMLSVILGHAELALMKISPADRIRGDLEAIHKAAEQSSNLTKQLLAFARKQTIAPKVFDLNDAVEGMLKMLRRLIGEDIELAWLPSAGRWRVNLDPAQIDQVLANLCINARDAIGGVGQITIETNNICLEENLGSSLEEIKAGEYVALSVSDNGTGMDKETLDKLFEPFFTTKGVGKGTGLGLATVYGIVTQNKGYIKVYSEPGVGTTIKIYLPRYAGDEPPALKSDQIPVMGGFEVILLVEDEAAIRHMTATMLESQGYKVLQAASPGEAIKLADKTGVDLLLTDVIMPEMNGKDLAARLRHSFPNLTVLFMSGYTANVIAHHGILDGGTHFLHKPFSMSEMASMVRKALVG